MCALVLALRKVPIYAPGGGGAVLGSVDQPTYSVAVSNEQAEAARDRFAKTKSETHMKTSRSKKSWNDLGVSTSAQTSVANGDSSLRNRGQPIGPNSETEALNALNTRSPTADIPDDWENDSPVHRRPSSRTHSPRLPPSSDQRNKDIDEVYGLLSRASTRGKRRESYGLAGRSESLRNSTGNNTIPIIEEPPLPGNGYDYHDYAREGSNQGQSKNSPPRDAGGAKPGEGGTTGFGASYNPYVSPAPKYDYPPGSPPRSEGGPMSATAPLTSSSVYPSPMRTTGTTPAQEQRMNPVNNSPPRSNRKNAYAAELDGQGRLQ